MRRIYTKCDKCGKGILFKLPRPGQEPYRIAQGFNWDGVHYRKNRTIHCDDCRKRKEGKFSKPRYLIH